MADTAKYVNLSLFYWFQVIDKNDPASTLVLDSSGIFENATTGTVVGKLSAKDQDKNQLHSFTVISPKGIKKTVLLLD